MKCDCRSEILWDSENVNTSRFVAKISVELANYLTAMLFCDKMLLDLLRDSLENLRLFVFYKWRRFSWKHQVVIINSLNLRKWFLGCYRLSVSVACLPQFEKTSIIFTTVSIISWYKEARWLPNTSWRVVRYFKWARGLWTTGSPFLNQVVPSTSQREDYKMASADLGEN